MPDFIAPECLALGYKTWDQYNRECRLWAVLYPPNPGEHVLRIHPQPGNGRPGSLSVWVFKQRTDVRVVVLRRTKEGSGYEKVSEPAWWCHDEGQSPPNKPEAIVWVRNNVKLEEISNAQNQ